jgi:hypothetical protein
MERRPFNIGVLTIYGDRKLPRVLEHNGLIFSFDDRVTIVNMLVKGTNYRFVRDGPGLSIELPKYDMIGFPSWLESVSSEVRQQNADGVLGLKSVKLNQDQEGAFHKRVHWTGRYIEKVRY